MKVKNPRLIAFEILHKIFTEKAYSNITLEYALRDINNDKAFISALVYGTVERKITLEYYIDKYVDKKPKAKVLTLLYLGAYQIKFMDKVPSSAAINETVKLSKELKLDYYSALINAVLHKIDSDKTESNDIYIKYSVPENLLNMWIKQYGRNQVLSFLPYINGRPPVYAVANRIYLDANELQYELSNENIDCEAVDDVVKINSSFSLNSLKAFKNGLFHIEDLSSYKCALSLSPSNEETVFDMCSAPGGKAFTIAEKMNNTGRVFAFDLYEHRVKKINEGAARLGLDNIIGAVNDATVFNSKLPPADKVLCDVPCSGFGIIRRKPEIRYKELDSINGLPAIQLKILEISSMYLKKGGRLVYSTCTLNKKENEQVVEKFIFTHRNFKLIEQETEFPDINGGDGFFKAVMVKNEN